LRVRKSITKDYILTFCRGYRLFLSKVASRSFRQKMQEDWKKNTRSILVPQQKTFEDGKAFPKILSPTKEIGTKDQMLEWATQYKQELTIELRDQGAILFRGFPIDGAEDFNDFVEALGIENLPYIGGAAVRHAIYKNVHTTNESPPDQVIPFHHEMAQVPLYPQTLFFYCDTAPLQGIVN
jgi:hypothetical protein